MKMNTCVKNEPHIWSQDFKKPPKPTNLATMRKYMGRPRSVNSDDLGKVRFQCQRSDIIYNKLRSGKRDFGGKSAGGCSTYDVIAP